QKAITETTIAIKINRNWPAAYLTRAKAYDQLRMHSEAQTDLDTIPKLHPVDKAVALNAVAWCRATYRNSSLRNGKKAVSQAMQACELEQWKHWAYMDTLAAAYAEDEDFQHATEYQKKALQ